MHTHLPEVGTVLAKYPPLYVAVHPHYGRGVYTSTNISEGDVIEVCPLIVLNVEDRAVVELSVLGQYVYEWDQGNSITTCALALGYGSLYNHSSEQHNAYYMHDERCQTIEIVAEKDIAAGSEILIDYGYEPEK